MTTMNDSFFDRIQACAEYLKIEQYTDDIAAFAMDQSFSEDALAAALSLFEHIRDRKNEAIVSTLLHLSRLPQKQPKTFAGFDFSCVHGKQIDELKSLPTLSTLYAHRNIAFIGPQGVGKTHLAMAYGDACCKKGFKKYFLKASELNQKFEDAIKYGRESGAVNYLVKPTCLIVDEIGRCVFSKEATRMFFDVIDRRYSKEGPNTMIFTSNFTPDKWKEFFNEDSSLLCSIDRIFDDAIVFMMRGESYRGKKLETVALETGIQLKA